MLNGITLFFILFFLWVFSSIFIGITPLFLVAGLLISVAIAFICWRLGIITSKTTFLILQFNFYKFIFKKINEGLFKVVKISFQFLNPKHKFKPVLDYVFLNKDKDSEAVLAVNLITFLAGTLCVAIKKRYVIVHSLDRDTLSPSDLYNISSEVGKVYDDSLV